MNVKKGDNVRYLNAVGGGVVTGFKGKDVALVLEPDGFETPVLIKEIVVVPATNDYNFPTETVIAKPALETEAVEENEPEVDATEKLLEYTFNERDETKEGEVLNLYLAFVPDDIKQLQTTDMKLYLVNDSNYYLQFQLLSGNEEWHIRKAETIEPQTKLYLEELNKLQLNDVSSLRFQAIAFKKHSFSVKPAIDIALDINPVKFYKLHSFKENDFFDADALMVTLMENDVMDLGLQLSAADIQKAILEKNISTVSATKPIKKHVNAEILEVDLHISALLDSTNGMSNAEMLKVQMDKFHEVMNAHLKNKGKKIVFIHGKGEGVLRKEIEKELKRLYKKCYFQDASFQQYGFGATQVTIH